MPVRMCILALGLLVQTQAPTSRQAVRHVDDDALPGGNGETWATSFRYFQDALRLAVAGDQILVAGGTYRPDLDEVGLVAAGVRTETFHLASGITLYGGYAGLANPADPDARNIILHESILSGDLDGDDGPGFMNYDDNSYHVVTGSGTDDTAILDGFTVKAGNADGTNDDARGGGMCNDHGAPSVRDCTFTVNLAASLGGGMYNLYANPTLHDCTFEHNRADGGGGMNNSHSSPRIDHCAFLANSAETDGGGIRNAYESSPVLTHCTFHDNTSGNHAYYAGGGGMHNIQDCSPTLTDCIFVGNSAVYAGGAMRNRYNSNPAITNCTFLGNWAEVGGAVNNREYCTPTLENCAFSGNWATGANGGGGMCNSFYSHPTLVNCTFAQNSATAGGGVLNLSESSPVLLNCILWGDSPQEVHGYLGSPVLRYCDVEGGWPGPGNLAADPRFIDPDGPDGIPGTDDDDLRLLPDSPCVNGGDPASAPEAGAVDLDGEDRLQGCRVDLGAYETAMTQVQGDFDGNARVDLADFGYFQLCFEAASFNPDWARTCLCVLRLH